MQQVLSALNHRRAARLLNNVHKPLHPKEPRAEVLRDPVQKKLRFLARERTLAHENEILNTPAFEMVTVGVKRMIMLVTITFVMMSKSKPQFVDTVFAARCRAGSEPFLSEFTPRVPTGRG